MSSKSAGDPSSEDADLEFTVATVWRSERVSCPHPDLLKTHLAGGLEAGASEFIEFHLGTSECPYCNAVIDDLRAADEDAKKPKLEDLRERLMRSTVAALRDLRGRDGA